MACNISPSFVHFSVFFIYIIDFIFYILYFIFIFYIYIYILFILISESHAKFILNSEDDLFDSPPARVPQSANPNDSIDVSFHCDPNESNTDGDGLSFTTNMSLEASLEEERQRVRQKNRARDKVEEIEEKIEPSKDKIEPSVDSKNSLNSFSMQATPLFAFREPVLSQVTSLPISSYSSSHYLAYTFPLSTG